MTAPQTTNQRYQYYCRPGYGNTNLLIEFISIKEGTSFFNILYDALKSIGCKVEGTTDLWMNDEMLLSISSQKGNFEISVDAYDFIFIMADDNQEAITAIDAILQEDARFEKVLVDFSKYKLQ